MVNILDIAPRTLWDEMSASKMVNVQTHPTLPLKIYNYSQNASFSKTWNDVTLASRGLIADENGEIVGRPFTKFFNYSELQDAPKDDLVGSVVISDKLDGSMGIGYVNSETGALNIATRGSFASDQAKHATDLYLSRYDKNWTPRVGFTYMWEIIYPENRIVLNYGDLDDLVLIGRVDNETGMSAPLDEIIEWPWARAEVLPYNSLEDALQAPARNNAEGVVVHFVDTDARVKVKQDDYIKLHRIVTGVTARRVWEIMRSDGTDLEAWLADTPEEFADFIRSTAKDIQDEKDTVENTARKYVSDILSTLTEDSSKKDFALKAKGLPAPYKGLAFSLYDHKSIEKALWDAVKPGHQPLTNWG